jgi:hypothetical protein
LESVGATKAMPNAHAANKIYNPSTWTSQYNVCASPPAPRVLGWKQADPGGSIIRALDKDTESCWNGLNPIDRPINSSIQNENIFTCDERLFAQV